MAASPSDPLNFPFVVVGNKKDLADTERKVNREEVEAWTKSRRVTVCYETKLSVEESHSFLVHSLH